MKQTVLPILYIMLMSMVGVKTYAYDIAVENADGKTIYYNFINNDNELLKFRGLHLCEVKEVRGVKEVIDVCFVRQKILIIPHGGIVFNF